jgi:hypothetical protein
MLKLPVIKLPNEFVQLLKESISISATSYRQVSEFIYTTNSFRFIIQDHFSEYDPNKNITNIVKNLGWLHFRDRLSSIYIYRTMYHSYPMSTDIRLVNEIIQFENRFAKFSVESNSRLFLLGFYLKMVEINLGFDLSYIWSNFTKNIDKILSIRQSHNPQIDWLILFIWHMDKYLGTEQFLELAHEVDVNCYDMMRKLNDKDRHQMVENMLNYGASIDDIEFFTYQKV